MYSAFALLLIALAHARGAVPSEPSLRDFVHTAWTHHEGVPLGSVIDTSQTTDGYLWVTTSEGLLRFDGVRFVAVPSPCGRPGDVTQAKSDGAGGLWLLCDYRIFHRDAAGRAEEVKQSLLPANLRPSMLFHVDRGGRLWLWGRSLAYLRPDRSEGPEIPGTERPSEARYCSFAEDSEGNLWFNASGKLLRIRNDRVEQVLPGSYTAVTPSRAGGVYALRRDSLVHYRTGSPTTIVDFGNALLAPNGPVLQEAAGGIWFGTRSLGLALLQDRPVRKESVRKESVRKESVRKESVREESVRERSVVERSVPGRRLDTFAILEGLSSGRVNLLFVDREGSVWVGTALGLHRFREPVALLISSADGRPIEMPNLVFHDRANGLWIGSSAGTVRIDRLSGRAEWFNTNYSALAEGQSGRIWAATRQELGYLEGNRFVPVRDSTGAPIPLVNAIRADSRGELWALSDGNGLYRIAGGRPDREIPGGFSHDFLVSDRHGTWLAISQGGLLRRIGSQETVFSSDSGLAGGTVHAIHEDGDSVWIGTIRGLSRWRNGKWTTWTSGHGLPGRGDIFEITSDSQGRLWIMSGGGILAMSHAQLDSTPDGQPRRLAYLRIGSLDRVVPHRGGMVSSPRVTKGPDEKFFFATLDAVAVVDAKKLSEQSFVPPILLEAVLINRRPVAPGAAARFVRPEDVQFEYTSLSLRNPENVRFRYMLEGHDPDWVEAGTQRRATYGSLKPRNYRFRVIGSGSEGVWNEAGASYTFRIAAPFYETLPFLLAVLGSVAALIWSIHRYRLRLAADRIRLRLEAQSDERLRIAQDMHDTFLQGIHGSALMVQTAIEYLEAKPSETRVLLDRALQMVAQSTDQARQMLTTLRARTPSRKSLVARLESMAAREASLYPEAPRVAVETLGSTRELHPAAGEDVYRIASEALQNSLRHSAARRIRIVVAFTPAEFQLTVVDDGIGIEPDILESGRSSHFGLQGMRERAERHSGVLRIESRAGQGAEVRLSIPGATAYS